MSEGTDTSMSSAGFSCLKTNQTLDLKAADVYEFFLFLYFFYLSIYIIQKSKNRYSFGLVMWFLIAEQTPYAGLDNFELLAQKVIDEKFRPSLLNFNEDLVFIIVINSILF